MNCTLLVNDVEECGTRKAKTGVGSNGSGDLCRFKFREEIGEVVCGGSVCNGLIDEKHTLVAVGHCV